MMDKAEFYDIVELSIDLAFQGKYKLNMYDYLKSIKATKKDMDEFLESATSREIELLIIDLDDYLEGGSDEIHKQLREAYGHLGKPEARKIRNYLNAILQDAEKYGKEKRPGRKRKTSK
jgi:hypothetical protein